MVDREKNESSSINPDGEFTIRDLIELIESYGMVDIQLDFKEQEIIIGNQDDLHKFMIATGVAKAILDSEGRPIKDKNGILKLGSVDGRVRVLDSSGYGQPYHTHPVRFKIGTKESWQVLANPRVPKPE